MSHHANASKLIMSAQHTIVLPNCGVYCNVDYHVGYPGEVLKNLWVNETAKLCSWKNSVVANAMAVFTTGQIWRKERRQFFIPRVRYAVSFSLATPTHRAPLRHQKFGGHCRCGDRADVSGGYRFSFPPRPKVLAYRPKDPFPRRAPLSTGPKPFPPPPGPPCPPKSATG